MGPEVGLVVVLLTGSVLVALMIRGMKESANAPIEKLPPPQKPKKMLFGFGDKALAAAASRHGLRHHLDVVTGRVDGFRVEITARPTGTAEREALRFEATASFPRKLGLELSVRRVGTLALGLGRERVAVSDAFDMAFVVEALHADQAQKLLGEAVGEALLYAERKGWKPRLDDRGLEILVSGRSSAETVAEAFAWLIDTARAVAQARSSLPRPELEQRALDAFAVIAAQRAGHIDKSSETLVIDDDLGTLRIRIERSEGKAFETVVEMDPRRPFGADLHLGLESKRSALERWRQSDVQLGDEELDAHFVVRGESDAAVRALFGAEGRAKLHSIKAVARDFELDPTGLKLVRSGAVGSDEEIDQLLELVLSTVRTLSPEVERSAYR